MKLIAPTPILKNSRDTVEVRKAFSTLARWTDYSIFGEEFGYKPERGRFLDFSNGWKAQETPAPWAIPIRDENGLLSGDIEADTFIVEDEAADATCYPIFVNDPTGAQAAKTDIAFTYDPTTGTLTMNTGIFNTLCRPDAADGASLGDATYPWSDLHLAEGGTINWDNGDVTLTQNRNTLLFDGMTDFNSRINAANLFYGMYVYSDTTTHRGLFDFYKSGSDTLGADAATVGTDVLGSIRFFGNSGSAFTLGAHLYAIQSGTAGAKTPTNIYQTICDSTTENTAYLISSAGAMYFYHGANPYPSDGCALGSTTYQWSDLYLAEGGTINWDNGDVTLTQAGDILTLAGGSLVAPIVVLSTDARPLSDSGAALGTLALGFSGLSLALSADPGAVTNRAWLHSRDSSAGTSNATLAIRTEQAVESIGTFTASHKLRVWINNVEYWIQLDAV